MDTNAWAGQVYEVLSSIVADVCRLGWTDIIGDAPCLVAQIRSTAHGFRPPTHLILWITWHGRRAKHAEPVAIEESHPSAMNDKTYIHEPHSVLQPLQ